jgi:hypothetical protein
MAMVTFEATDEEKKVFEKMAKKEGVSMSDYVRGCVYFDLMFSGDLDAMRLMSRRIREKGAKAFERFRQPRFRKFFVES